MRARVGRFVTRVGVRVMRLGVRIEGRNLGPDDPDGMIAT